MRDLRSSHKERVSRPPSDRIKPWVKCLWQRDRVERVRGCWDTRTSIRTLLFKAESVEEASRRVAHFADDSLSDGRRPTHRYLGSTTLPHICRQPRFQLGHMRNSLQQWPPGSTQQRCQNRGPTRHMFRNQRTSNPASLQGPTWSYDGEPKTHYSMAMKVHQGRATIRQLTPSINGFRSGPSWALPTVIKVPICKHQSDQPGLDNQKEGTSTAPTTLAGTVSGVPEDLARRPLEFSLPLLQCEWFWFPQL